MLTLTCERLRQRGTQPLDWRHACQVLMIPDGVELPAGAAAVVARMRKCAGDIQKNPRHTYRVTPSSERIALGAFRRDGRRVVLVVNVGKQPYTGQLSVPPKSRWIAMDPGTVAIGPVERASPLALRLALAPGKREYWWSGAHRSVTGRACARRRIR